MTRLAIAVLTCALAFAADGSFVGTWRLNPTKSTFDPNGPRLGDMTVRFVQEGAIVNAIVTTNGSTAPAIPIDGTEQPNPGNVPSIAGSTHHVSRLKGETITTEFRKEGKVVATREITLDPGGKSFTSVLQATRPNGQKYKSVAVFDRK